MGQRYTPGFLICDVGKAGKDISARLRQELLEQELENKQHTRVCVCVCVCVFQMKYQIAHALSEI